jgi:hypothetical protein
MNGWRPQQRRDSVDEPDGIYRFGQVDLKTRGTRLGFGRNDDDVVVRSRIRGPMETDDIDGSDHLVEAPPSGGHGSKPANDAMAAAISLGNWWATQ